MFVFVCVCGCVRGCGLSVCGDKLTAQSEQRMEKTLLPVGEVKCVQVVHAGVHPHTHTKQYS